MVIKREAGEANADDDDGTSPVRLVCICSGKISCAFYFRLPTSSLMLKDISSVSLYSIKFKRGENFARCNVFERA